MEDLFCTLFLLELKIENATVLINVFALQFLLFTKLRISNIKKIIVLFPQISSLSEIYHVRMLIEFDIGMDIKCIMPLNLPAVKLITNYNHSLHGDSIPRWRCWIFQFAILSGLFKVLTMCPETNRGNWYACKSWQAEHITYL